MSAPRIDKIEANALLAASVIPAKTVADVGMISVPYTTVVNRAQIPDLANDGSVRMGIERIPTQNISLVPNELGPAGEQVFMCPNDQQGLIRFVGNWLTTNNNATATNSGAYPYTATVNSYVEITFYGTGLNILGMTLADTRNFVASVDGGAEGSNLLPGATVSQLFYARGYSPNQIVSVASNLALGVHTVKIRVSSVGSGAPSIHGFEIINESSTLNIRPAKLLGNKTVNTITSATTSAYNLGFESGTLGTRGGHVLVYTKSDGTTAKAVTPTNASAAYLTSADHTNEEVIRSISTTEFGTNRSDDFSLAITASNYAGILEDGSTTLVGSSVTPNNPFNGANGVGYNAGGYLSLAFVGTGLDIVINSTSANTVAVSVDGTSQGNITTGTTGIKTYPVVSGLPYGSHVVRFTIASPASIIVMKFVTYQPKKPALPTGAIEQAEYCILANFAANSTAGLDTISTGTIRKKIAQREAILVNGTGGTADWTTGFDISNCVGAWSTYTDRNGAYFEYIFFGTGFDFRFYGHTNRSTNIQAALQSLSTGGSLINLTATNFNTASFSTYGTGVVFTSSTGILDQQDASNPLGSGFVCSGLPLGLYKIRFTNNTASSYIEMNTLDIITPIHTFKSNLTAGNGNTLSIGSCSLSDLRRPANLPVPVSNKAWGVAYGNASVTTTATAFIPVPDLSIPFTTKGGLVLLGYNIGLYNTSSATAVFAQLAVDGVLIGRDKQFNVTSASSPTELSDTFPVYLPPGTYKIDVYWRTSSSTLGADSQRRDMFAVEL